MSNPNFRPIPLAAAIVATAFAAPAFASLLDDAGAIVTLRELESATNHNFRGHDVAALPDGGFAVVWAEVFRGTDYDNFVRLQRFDASGSAVGDELTLYQHNNDQGTSRFSQPAVAADEDGDLVVAWTTPGSHCYGNLFVQTLEAEGDWENLPEPTQVSEKGCAPQLAMDTDGDFALTWREPASTLLRTYAANGTPYQAENITLVHGSTSNIATPALAIQPHGEIMIAWENSDNNRLYGQRFNLNGTTLDATPFLLDNRSLTDDTKPQHNPVLAAYGNDGFVAFWDEREFYPLANVDKVTIRGQRWHGDGTPGKALTAGDTISGTAVRRTAPTIGTDSDANLLVAWQGHITNETSETSLTHFDDRLSIAVLNVPFIEPENLDDGSWISPPRLVMSNDQAVLVWVQSDDGKPERLEARVLASLVEEQDPIDNDDGDGTGNEGDTQEPEDNGETDHNDEADDTSATEESSNKRSGGAGGMLSLLLVALLGARRWLSHSPRLNKGF